jgi:hypothetical protein
MRRSLLLATIALAGGCYARLPPLGPSNPEQIVQNDPHSAATEAGSVRITVHPDDWRGYPSDLDEYVTPVELFVENGSAREIVIRHTLFSLGLPNGFRYDALAPAELRRFLTPRGYYGANGYWYYGAFGVYPWPGLYIPGRHYYPYLWWGDPWFGPSPLPPPPPPRPSVAPTPPGTLAPGGKVSVLVFFPVPANSLGSFTFEAQIMGSDGTTLGNIRVPFERREAPKPGARPTAPTPQP